MTKVKSAPNPTRRILFLSLVLTITTLCTSVYYVVWHEFGKPFIITQAKINEMLYWTLPAQTEIVAFETEVFGDSTNFIKGELTVSTTLSEVEIRDFYQTNYQPNCLGFEAVVWTENQQDAQAKYLICHIIEIE